MASAFMPHEAAASPETSAWICHSHVDVERPFLRTAGSLLPSTRGLHQHRAGNEISLPRKETRVGLETYWRQR